MRDIIYNVEGEKKSERIYTKEDIVLNVGNEKWCVRTQYGSFGRKNTEKSIFYTHKPIIVSNFAAQNETGVDSEKLLFSCFS